MAKAKKFGTFSGVFSPSILTILGVIMYLRFPSIIGQAGLINTIGIIVIAHIISITTSLSVASLSTDKPVQNGGTYFMISRSLGLPIGGTLGLALFVGLAFSVSLYLIGFSESFLQYWGLENNINTIRITGTIVLIAVTTITFISTSLAIKSQYFIMVAIALSLLSIFLGKHDFAPTEINLAPLASAAPFMVLFGIFFPAVTGFEAGVSMSGDLKDPKKSLPYGAMMAVGVGFVVYIALAFFYAITVDSNALVNDPQILFKISLVPQLVIAGIWGATLSSALGSILGAPRILQAIAMDKIAPKVFAKGTGKTNEPRNALLLAFAIAEAGILIGELDVIARIVSMFFITTYAFLNLASAIESWSSSDYRPAFKIPKFISIIGALSAFFVMILLDFLALAGATVVLGLLYFYLQRKELILESGDAWSSFWTNLAKKALLKLSGQKANSRNWRPNILLFSGGEKARPYLVEMGLSLTGKLGALTDFKLSTTDAKVNRIENAKFDSKNKSYFIREFPCDTIQNGIKTVTTVYGFSGFEPNTVLMGWSQDVKNADFLVSVLKDLKSKNLNAIFLDYDKNNGFGKKEKIDIWWNGKGRFLNFSLNLLRFLSSDAGWLDAEVRIMIINSDTSLYDSIYRNTNAILTEKRVKAEVRVISDDFGSRTKEEIINSESVNADLIVLGLSQKNTAFTNEYINQINKLSNLPASFLILSPSLEFDEINLIEHLGTPGVKVPVSKSIELPTLPLILNKVTRGKIEHLDDDMHAIGRNLMDKTMVLSMNNLLLIIHNLQKFIHQNKANLERELMDIGKHEVQKTIIRNHQVFLRSVSGIINKSNKELIGEIEGTLKQGLTDLINRMGNYIYGAPDVMHIPFVVGLKKKEKLFKYPYQKAISFYVAQQIQPALKQRLDELEEFSSFELIELRKLILGINDAYEKITLNHELQKDELVDGIFKHISDFNCIEEKLIEYKNSTERIVLNKFHEIAIAVANDLESPAKIQQAKRRIVTVKDKYNDWLIEFSDNWGNGMRLINNTLYLDSFVLLQKNTFKNIIQKGTVKINTQITSTLVTPIDTLIGNLHSIVDDSDKQTDPVSFADTSGLLNHYNETYQKASDLIEAFVEEFNIPDSIYINSKANKFSDFNQITVNLNRTASYYIDVLFHEPFYREVESLDHIIKTATVNCKEANGMLLFHLNNLKEVNTNNDIKNSLDTALMKSLIAKVTDEKLKVEMAIERINHYSMIYLQEAFSKLFYHSIVDAEKQIYSEKRELKGKAFNVFVNKRVNSIKSIFNRSIVYLLNSASSGVLLSKKYLSEKEDKKVQVKQILDLVEGLLPDSKIYNSVPVFYRNLMSSASKINDDFFVSRDKEMNIIKEAMKRHKKGLAGAVVIKGVHGAGKTVLSRYAAYHTSKKSNVYWINPPVNGSTNTQDLLIEFRKQMGGFGDFDFDFVFNNIPFESTVVINDLELWWERRPGGGDVINKLIELIRKYSHKVFFVLNCNTYSFKALSCLFPIEENCQAIVECEPFSSKELQQLILQRHKTSGLSLVYNGRAEENISQLSYSILFNVYFNISEGIPGVAINTWKANIVDAKKDFLGIGKPRKANSEILYKLQDDWLIIIALFIQHKNMNAEKLARLTGMDIEVSEHFLMKLKNSGLIVKKTNDVYTLGRIIEPDLVEVCKRKAII